MNWDVEQQINDAALKNSKVTYERLIDIFIDHLCDIDYKVQALHEEGYTNADIGELLGIPESQVWYTKEKYTITCSQKYGTLSKITKWLMERGIQFYVDDYQAQLDDEAGYKIHLTISEAEMAGLDEYMSAGSFVYA